MAEPLSARKKTIKPFNPELVQGKLPPQATDLEEAVLGALMLDKDAVASVIDILHPECFYKDQHQKIYAAIHQLFHSTEPVDILTVTQQLRKNGDLEIAGGAYYITQLTNRVASAANIEYHARIILQKFIQRELIRISGETIRDAFEETTDVLDLLDRTEKNLFAVAEGNIRRNYEDMHSLITKAIKEVEVAAHQTAGVTGVPSGFTDLDRVTAGWQKSDLIIIAARPGMGKTALVLSMARNAAVMFNKPIAFFSCEMSSIQLVNRLISSETEINSEKLKKGQLADHEWAQLNSKISPLTKAPIYIDDTPALTVFELRAKCRRLAAEKKIELIIIDYLQLMVAGSDQRSGNREQEISTISRSLKSIAKELSVPIIALSQLSRAVESRGGSKKPQLSDLRECVTGDTLVWLTNGNRIPIKNLVGHNAEVWSLDADDKLTTSVTEQIWSVGTKDIYEIKLASGRTMRGTADHKIRCLNQWKTIKDIDQGERIAVARFFPEPLKPVSISKNKIILLAHLIGDGSYLTHQPLRYTTASEENSNIVKSCAEEEFGSIVNRHEYKGTWHQLVFSGNGNRWHPEGLNKWLRDIGVFNQRSHEKKIPEFIFNLSNENVCLFLQHLWATDGTIYSRSGDENKATRVAFSTNSKQLAEDVAVLLLRINIMARIRKVQQGEYKPVYSVDVIGKEDQWMFIEKIGAFDSKVKQLQALRQVLINRPTNTNVDTLPVEVFENVKSQMKLKGISQRKMAALRSTSYGDTSHFKFSPSGNVLNNYAEILEDNEIKKISSSDLFWDQVVAVTHSGSEEVFDLTVRDTHNWIANEGIVTHNSGAIEQDADMVLFIYRPEYYGLTEDENHAPTNNVAEIIVAKNRNGALKNVNLKFVGHLTKFTDLEDFDFVDETVKLQNPNVENERITRTSRMNDMEEEPPF